MAFPFLFLSLSLGAGILFSSLVRLRLSISVSILAACLCLAWLLYFLRSNKKSFALILLGMVAFGVSLYTLHKEDFEKNPLFNLEQSAYADFSGKLYKSPSLGPDRVYLYMSVEKVRYKNEEQRIRGRLRVTIPLSPEMTGIPELVAGDRITVSAQLLPLKEFRNFNEPTLERYFKSQRIHHRAFSKSFLLVQKYEGGKRYSPLKYISILRQKLQRKIEEHFSSEEKPALSWEGAILEALLLGERGRMREEDSRSLQKSGLFHLIAISGAHIAIISFLLFSVFKLIRIPKRPSYVLLALFLVFYAFLVEGRPSVLRATLMTLAYIIGRILWKDTSLLNAISIAAFFLLLRNPFSLFDMGFQLTFAATFTIILFFPKIMSYMPRLPLRISELFVLSLTAQLGVLPFLVSSFNRVSFSSLLLNLAAVPLVGVIMAFGYLFFLLSFLSSLLAGFFAQGIKILTHLFLSIARIFDGFPFFSYRIPTPSLLIVIGYFLFLFLLLVPFKVKRLRFVFFLCFVGFFTILISYPFPAGSKDLRLTFIDVGQGESILVEFPGRKKMLVDGGGFPEGSFDVGESVVSPFLWRKGIKRVDYLVLTHAHPDHMNGLKAVARNFKIREFWEGVSPEENESYTELKKSLTKSVLLKKVFRSFRHQEGNVIVEVLHPDGEELTSVGISNEQSLVIRISHRQTVFLLPGDIGIESEKDILEHMPDIRSQVLKSPHHGSLSSSSTSFLERVRPEIIVISVGKGNRYGFPNQEILDRYGETGAKIFRTDEDGAVELTSDGRHIIIRTAAGSR